MVIRVVVVGALVLVLDVGGEYRCHPHISAQIYEFKLSAYVFNMRAEQYEMAIKLSISFGPLPHSDRVANFLRTLSLDGVGGGGESSNYRSVATPKGTRGERAQIGWVSEAAFGTNTLYVLICRTQ